MNRNDQLYHDIESYALEKGLKNTLTALPLARQLLQGVTRTSFDFNRDGAIDLTYYDHCFSTAVVLMSLHMNLSSEEEDLLLAATLCHDLPVHIDELDPKVYGIIDHLGRQNPTRESDKRDYYQRVAEAKLPFLLAIADRGNLMEYLYKVSLAEAIVYVNETRKYFLTMCVRGKELYPELQQAISVLMEKLRCLSDVTDMISSHYQQQETAYTNEILSLMEENARIRGIISATKK